MPCKSKLIERDTILAREYRLKSELLVKLTECLPAFVVVMIIMIAYINNKYIIILVVVFLINVVVVVYKALLQSRANT